MGEPYEVEEFMTLSADTLGELEDLIDDCLEDGWKSYGQLFTAVGTGQFFQSMYMKLVAPDKEAFLVDEEE